MYLSGSDLDLRISKPRGWLEIANQHHDGYQKGRRKRLLRNSVVPPGLGALVPLDPGLPSWAKLGRPCRAEIELASFHYS